MSGGVRRLVLSGYYGFNNSGDEAVLRSILNALAHEGQARGIRVEPVVLSADPAWTSRQYGVEAVPRMSIPRILGALRASDGLISGGGSLLQDATGLGSIPYYLGIMEMARWLGRPVFVYAQGIGPVQRPVFRGPIARAFRKAAYVSVRDEESAALVRGFGVPAAHVEVVPDPVMAMPMLVQPAESVNGMRGAETAGAEMDEPMTVGVSVRFWREDRADLMRIADALSAMAARRAVRLRFLPFHAGPDEEASRFVMARLAPEAAAVSELAPAAEDPRAMLAEVGRCRLLFGMRLHALIYAANREVPLLGLSYDPKIDQFLRRLGERAVGTTDALDRDEFASRACALLDDPAAWRSAAAPVIAQLREQSIRPAQQILDYRRIN